MINITANGNTILRRLPAGKEVCLALSGTFASATVTLQYSKAGTWVTPATDAVTFSAAGEIIATNCGDSDNMNLLVASATGSTDIDVIVTPL